MTNEKRLAEMVEAVMNRAFPKEIHEELFVTKQEIRFALAPFCTEMTDEEIANKSDQYDKDYSFTAEVANLAFRDGAKFYRDRDKK